jgi:hypothetical protein
LQIKHAKGANIMELKKVIYGLKMAAIALVAGTFVGVVSVLIFNR